MQKKDDCACYYSLWNVTLECYVVGMSMLRSLKANKNAPHREGQGYSQGVHALTFFFLDTNLSCIEMVITFG